MYHGANEPRVPVSQSKWFHDALLAAGSELGSDGDFEYHERDDSGHFSADTDGDDSPLALYCDFLERRL